jgi:DNA-binding response OmpR family regulator
MNSPTILCVDDSPLVHSLVTRALQPYDTRLVHAEDGMMGFHFALNESPELVLLDVKMPGLNGYQLLERLRKEPRTCHVPVLVITSETVRENILQLLKFGIQDYIVKPFDESTLVGRISRHIPLHRRGISAKPLAPNDATRKPVSKTSSQKLTAASIMPKIRPTAMTTKLRLQKFNIADGQPMEGIRDTTLAEKLDDYVLLLGSMNAFLVGIFMKLLESGKVRVEFRDRCERLTLAEGVEPFEKQDAMQLLEGYMSRKGWSVQTEQPLGVTQQINLRSEELVKTKRKN